MSFDLKISKGDFSLTNGDLTKAEDNIKLAQDILKIAVTPLGSNPQFKAYGTLLSKDLIGQGFDGSFTSQMAASQLKNGIDLLRKLQQLQTRYQPITPAEQIVAIQEIKIEQSPVDLRYWQVKISILTGELKPASLGFSVQL